MQQDGAGSPLVLRHAVPLHRGGVGSGVNARWQIATELQVFYRLIREIFVPSILTLSIRPC